MASQGYYDGTGGSDSRDQWQARQGEAGYAPQPQGSMVPPYSDPLQQNRQGGPYAGNGQLFGQNPYQGQVNSPQPTYQNPYTQQESYPLQQQQQQQPYGGPSPVPYGQGSGYPPAQQYPSSQQANVSSQGYGPEYGAYEGAPGSSPDEAHGGERGLGTHIIGATIGHKLGRRADLGPVGVLAAGIVGAQVLGNFRDKRKHEKQ